MSLFDPPLAGDLTDMIATMTASLTETASVRRNSPTSDGQGGQTDSWGTAIASVAARRSDLSRDEEALIASRLTATTGYAVLVPANTAVRQADRIYFASDNTTMEIVGFGSNTWELVQRCLCVVVAGS